MVLYAAYKNELESTNPGAGGARLIGVEAIPGISATHLQAALEASVALAEARLADVQDEGVGIAFRETLNFTGEGVAVTDNASNDSTDIFIAGLSDYPHVEKVTQEGIELGQWRVLNITGSGATLTEDTEAGRWDLEIPGEITADVPVATETEAGKVRLSAPPGEADDPIVISDTDARMSDARVPVAHFHTVESLPVADEGEESEEKVVRSSDPRLFDARFPIDGTVTMETAAADTSVIFLCDSTSRPVDPKKGQIIYELDSTLLMKNAGTPAVPNWQPVGSGAANVTFQEEGVTIAQRATVNVLGEGATVLDNTTAGRTEIQIPGVTVQVSGSTVGTPHAKMNFIGASVADDAANSRTNVTIPAGVDASTSTKGQSKLSVAPVSSTNPIAVGDNDPRLTSIYTPQWAQQAGANAVFGAYGDADPRHLLALFYPGQAGSLPPDRLGRTHARIVSFSLPRALSLEALRMWTFSSGGNTFLAIYRHSDGARMWYTPSAGATVADTWSVYTTGLPVALAANTRYWIALATNTTGAGNRWRTLPGLPTGGDTIWGADSTFLAGGIAGLPAQARIAVSNGAYPATMPTILAADYNQEGGPMAFLTGTAS